MTQMAAYLAVLTVVVGVTFAAYDPDKIRTLPGLNTQPSFDQYSGYLNGSSTKKLHYWYVESQNSPASDPLVVWFNGGPGCSSVLGLLTEHGPFRVNPDGKTLSTNPYSWNKIVNMVYIEAPSGVGYSFDTQKHYATDDDEVAKNNYNAILNFLEKFSELKGRELYITGESYGGIYVPTLSALIVKQNQLNFKGFMVGNGLSDASMNTNSALYFAYYHGLVSSGYFTDLLTACCPSSDHFRCDFVAAGRSSSECQSKVEEGLNAIYGGDLNEYNVYSACLTGETSFSLQVTPDGHLRHHQLGVHSQNTSLNALHRKQLSLVPVEKLQLSPPCINSTAPEIYMNSEAVRQALHIPGDVPRWEVCSAVVGAQYSRLYNSMRAQYQAVLGSDSHRIMVYNGDVDLACNFLGDEWFVESLKLPLIKHYTQWFYEEGAAGKQIAGYAHQYKNLTFVTVKGAGHMVPTDKPAAAFVMFQHFISNTPF